MKVNAVALAWNNQSFGALKAQGVSRNARKYLNTKVFPRINFETIQDWDDMGYDIVFKKGNVGLGDANKEFLILLKDRNSSKIAYVNEIWEGSIRNAKRFNKWLSRELVSALEDLHK